MDVCTWSWGVIAWNAPLLQRAALAFAAENVDLRQLAHVDHGPLVYRLAPRQVAIVAAPLFVGLRLPQHSFNQGSKCYLGNEPIFPIYFIQFTCGSLGCSTCSKPDGVNTCPTNRTKTCWLVGCSCQYKFNQKIARSLGTQDGWQTGQMSSTNARRTSAWEVMDPFRHACAKPS